MTIARRFAAGYKSGEMESAPFTAGSKCSTKSLIKSSALFAIRFDTL